MVSGMFLLPYSALLMSFLHFSLVSWKPTLKWTPFDSGHLSKTCGHLAEILWTPISASI